MPTKPLFTIEVSMSEAGRLEIETTSFPDPAGVIPARQLVPFMVALIQKITVCTFEIGKRVGLTDLQIAAMIEGDAAAPPDAPAPAPAPVAAPADSTAVLCPACGKLVSIVDPGGPLGTSSPFLESHCARGGEDCPGSLVTVARAAG
jgi:hypothetical protein